MLIAKLTQDLKIEKVADIAVFGGFSDYPSDLELAERGFRKVNLWKPHNKNTEKLVSCEPYLEGQWVFTVKIEKLSTEESIQLKNLKIEELKAQRNQLLALSDWTQLPDASLDIVSKDKWTAYRRSVKEVVTNYIKNNTISPWPSIPE